MIHFRYIWFVFPSYTVQRVSVYYVEAIVIDVDLWDKSILHHIITKSQYLFLLLLFFFRYFSCSLEQSILIYILQENHKHCPTEYTNNIDAFRLVVGIVSQTSLASGQKSPNQYVFGKCCGMFQSSLKLQWTMHKHNLKFNLPNKNGAVECSQKMKCWCCSHWKSIWLTFELFVGGEFHKCPVRLFRVQWMFDVYSSLNWDPENSVTIIEEHYNTIAQFST